MRILTFDKRLKNQIAGVLCAASLFLSVVSCAAAADVKADSQWTVTPYLPAETLAVITLRDAKKAAGQFQQTGIWQIATNADVQRAFSGPLLKAQMGVAVAEGQLGMKISDLASWISQGEITFAVLSVDHRNEKGEPLPDLLLSVQAMDKSHLVVDEINRRIDQLKGALNGNLPADQIPVGDELVHQYTIPIPGNPVSFAYAEVNGTVLVTLGGGRLEKLLAMREAAKLNNGTLPDKGAPQVLSQVPAFKKAMDRAGAATDLLAYVNVEGLMKNEILDAHPKTDKQRRDVHALGIDTVRAVCYCAGVKGKGIRETFVVDSPAAQRGGVLSLIDEGGADAAALAAAPKNSLIAAAFKITPDSTLQKVVNLAAIENPNAREELNTFMAMLGQQLNLDVRREIFGALTGQAVFSVGMPVRHSKLPVAFPVPLLSVEIKDIAALKNTLSAVRRAMQDNFLLSELADGEHEIVVARERYPKGKQAGQFAYTIDKNHLLVSLYPLALREELKRRLKGDAAESLADDPDFSAAQANLSGAKQFLTYVDMGALATAAYDVLMPIAQLQPKNSEVDVNLLPAADLVSQNLGGAVMGLGADADGVVAEGYSPAGSVIFAMLAIPAAAKARENANQTAQAREVEQQVNQRQDVMQDIARDLKAFVNENGGNYPASLVALQPKYLAGFDANRIASVVYRGKQDAPNKVVVHSSEKMAGPITALLQDGSVVKVKRQKWGTVLQKGYMPDAAAPALANATDGQLEAIKPPAPPDF